MTDIERTFTQIANRVIHIRSIVRQAVDILLERDRRVQTAVLTLSDMERYIEHWRFLIPQDPMQKAHILQHILNDFAFSPQAFPQMAAALGVETDEVQTAFEEAYGKVLKAQFTDDIPDDDTGQDTEAARDLRRELDWHYLKRGEQLFQQGDRGDYLYGVVEGRLEVSIRQVDGRTVSVEVHSGALVGEEAIMTQIPYGASVTALRDSDLVRLHRDAFERLVVDYPRGMMQLAYQIMQRSQQITGMIQAKPHPQSIVILHTTAGTHEFAPRLADVFDKYQQMSTRVLNPSQLGEIMAPELLSGLEGIVDDYVFVDWLQSLAQQFDMLILEGDLQFPNWTRRAIEQADHVLIVGRVGESFDFTPWQKIINRMSHGELQPQRELIMLHETQAPGHYNTYDWISKMGELRHHHIALDSNAGFERIIRFLLGKAVGLVFGGGGMRGVCHHGAIQAFNEAGITADVVGGTSAGAIVAAQYAMGWSVDEMFKRTKEELMRRDVLINLTFPIVAFNTGHKVTELFKNWFGGVYSEDLWTTCFTVSANLTCTYQSTNQYGLLWRNVRYSTSIAGLYPPMPDENGYLHIDGGVYDNTPSDVMRQFVGAGVVIAIDLGYTEREPVRYDYGEYLNGWQVLFNRLNPFSQSMKVILITDVLMQSNALAARAATTAQMAPSDLVINPGVSGFGLFDFDAADDLYKVGYDAAVKSLTDSKFAGEE